MDNSRRAYNTYEENQRIRESARIAKREGTNGPIPTTVNINNSKRAYNTYEENQRIKASIRVYNKELARDEGAEIQAWMFIIDLPEAIRKWLLNKLLFILPIYDVLVVFGFYKLTLLLDNIFGYSEKLNWLFNSPYKLSSAEIQGNIFYFLIFGLPILYTLIIVLSFSIHTITDTIRIIKKSNISQKKY